MRNCSHHVDHQLDAYLDGELSLRQRLAVSSHLKMCERCRKALEERRIISRELSSLPLLAPPERVVGQVMGQIRQQQPGPTLYRRAFRVPALAWRLAACLAVAALLLVVIWPAYRNISPRYSPEEVSTARADVNRALGYLGAATELTQEAIARDVLSRRVLKPVQMGLNAAFQSMNRNGG